jgi:hypothetical protein
VKSLIEMLDPEELTDAREVMRAMTPEMRARLEGQSFSRRDRWGTYTNKNKQCVLSCAFGISVICDSDLMIEHLPDVDSGITYTVAFLNDRGWLRTRARVWELLALAED